MGTRDIRYRVIAGGIIVVLIAVAYWRTLGVPFLFDDRASILDNESIQSLWAPEKVFAPPGESGTGGRPFANFTLAVSHAISGRAPWGYHLLNLMIHAGAACVLGGVVRRTIGRPEAARWQEAALLAGGIALLWAMHPLQTQTVTYVSQRTEALMAFFYLLTLYGFIRGTEGNAAGWRTLSVVACLLGAMSKEVIITAPLVVLLYDRTFVAGTFLAALRQRWGYYAGLALSWPLLAWLLTGVGQRGVGLGLGIGWQEYALTQCKAVVLYAALGVWPQPLVFDRGPLFLSTVAEALPYAVGLAALLGGTIWALIRAPKRGFVGAVFFLILAPTSSVVPVIQSPIAENRAYLPLAAVLAAGVLGLRALVGLRATCGLCAATLAAGVVATAGRNRDYQSELRLWSDTVAKAPANYRAHNNLGLLLADQAGRLQEARAHFETALRLKPDDADAHSNLAVLLSRRPEERAEAIRHYAIALQVKPDRAAAHNNLANLLAADPGRAAEARHHYEVALRLKPGQPETHHNFAQLLANQLDRPVEAAAHYEAALRLRSDYAEAHSGLGLLLARQPGREAEARRHYEAALRARPAYAEAHNNLAILLAGQSGRESEAIGHYETALRLRPDYPEAHRNLANLLGALPDRTAEAIIHYETALRLRPGDAAAHNNLAVLLARQPDGRARAIAHYEEALRLNPDQAEAHNNLGLLLGAQSGRGPEAIAHFEAALRLRPGSAVVHFNLARELAKLPGRQEEAAGHFSAVLRLNPGFAPAAEALRRLQGARP